MNIAYTDFWQDFNPETLLLTKLIKKCGKNLQETNNLMDTDYLLYSCMGNQHWNAPENVIKIYYTGECLTPDFNACDYAIGFDWLDFGDRYLRFPLYYLYTDICEQMETKHLKPIFEIVGDKTDFCSITVSNSNRNPIFKELFEKLSIYKQVDSGGRWMNNIGGTVQNKFAFDLSHKFSIVCENSSCPGYTTEKIVQAFAANCIPIYWGDPFIAKVFNKKAFINVQDYASVNEVVEKVKEIDNSDNLYYEMLCEPVLLDPQFAKANQLIKLKQFLLHIFSQPPMQARRRNRDFKGKEYIDLHRNMNTIQQIPGLLTYLKSSVYGIFHKWL